MLSSSRIFPAVFFPTCATAKPTESTSPNDAMPDNVVESPYPLIDADPHFSRVVRYMRPSDYTVWAGATAAFPSAIYFWGDLIHLCTLLHSPRTLSQRWLTLQNRVCGLLYASAACLVSLAASYSPTSGQ